jgi:hypothetical protein
MWGKIGPRDSSKTRQARDIGRTSESVMSQEFEKFLVGERSRRCRNSIL